MTKTRQSHLAADHLPQSSIAPAPRARVGANIKQNWVGHAVVRAGVSQPRPRCSSAAERPAPRISRKWNRRRRRPHQRSSPHRLATPATPTAAAAAERDRAPSSRARVHHNLPKSGTRPTTQVNAARSCCRRPRSSFSSTGASRASITGASRPKNMPSPSSKHTCERPQRGRSLSSKRLPPMRSSASELTNTQTSSPTPARRRAALAAAGTPFG